MYPLTDFQKHIVDSEQVSNDGCCLFLTMGAGKTRVAIELIKKFKASRILIVSKSKLINDTWPNQIKFWGLNSYQYVSLANKPATKQVEYLSRGVLPHTIIGTNFESFGRAVATLNRPKRVDLKNSPILLAYERVDWDIIIVDESTCIKDPNSKVALSMLNLAYNCPNAYVMCLTGTPNPEASLDFYTQISMVDRGKRFGQSFIAFRDAYFYMKPYTFNYIPLPFGPDGKSIETLISELCKDMCYVLTDIEFNKISGIPERTSKDIYFELDAKSKAYYNQMKKSVVSMDKADITAANAAVVVSKLLQISSGILYGNDKERHAFGDSKIKALLKLLPTINGKVIVCYHFQASLDMLMLYLDLYNIPYALADKITEEEFNTSKDIKVLLLQPASGAYGSNYQADCSNMIWYEGQSSGEKFNQTEGRIHRTGQTKACTFYYLLGKDTYDKTARDKTLDKKANALTILKEIKKAEGDLQRVNPFQPNDYEDYEEFYLFDDIDLI